MTGRSTLSVLQHLHRLAREEQASKLSDQECLERFVAQRDEDAFAVLVRRHGPMVRGVCRRLLHHRQDAEDAFQATFLVLARKAGSVRWIGSIGPWLYQVAYRLASKARVDAARRREHERQAAAEPLAPAADPSWREVCAALDEELQALAEKYRAPLVLCYLEGQTRDEAAERLGWSLGTLKRRLQQGRELLRVRLTRRGVTLPAALLSAGLTGNEAGAALSSLAARSLAQAATAFASGGAISGPHLQAIPLAEGMLQMMSTKMVKVLAVLVLTLSAATGAGLWTCRMLVAEPPQQQPASPPDTARYHRPRQAAKEEQPRTDRYGDPLPPGVVARFGTVRLRHPNWVNGVAFTPDGKTLASAGWRGEIRLWESASGVEIACLRGHKHTVDGVTFSADGKTLVSAGGDGMIRVWDVLSRQGRFSVKGHEGSMVACVAIS
ncbi:MAG: sigma-70 family RNA polymerase sigma factor, partial [Gemmataceae bacterium]